jgi:dihydropyrimidinase
MKESGMADLDLVVSQAEVVSPEGQARASIGIRDGRIVEVGDLDPGRARQVADADGLIALPGIIDAHNHPYYDDDMVEFAAAAGHGGITALVSFAGVRMNAAGARPRVADVVGDFVSRARGQMPVDFAVHAIVGDEPDPDRAVRELVDMGIRSIKIFLAFPGSRMVDDARALLWMQAAARHDVLCMVHCENGAATQLLERQLSAAGRIRPLDYAASRPAGLEAEAVYRALALAEIAGCQTYIVHVTCAQALDAVLSFRQRGNIPIYAETCPHYLLLHEGDLDRLGGLAKISPPLRTLADIEALWAAVRDGAVDVIASDCSGQRAAPKQVDDIFQAPYGIPGVEHMLQLIWDQAVNRRRIPASTLAAVMSRNPARIFRLPGKGVIEAGADADLVLLDPRAAWTARAAEQHGNSDYCLYEGWTGRGRAVRTFRAGETLLGPSGLVGPARGRYIAR